jgi:hypothetical protein
MHLLPWLCCPSTRPQQECTRGHMGWSAAEETLYNQQLTFLKIGEHFWLIKSKAAKTQGNPNQNPSDHLCRNKKHVTTKAMPDSQGMPISQKILKKKNRVRGLLVPDFKTYNKATVTKTMWYWDKDTGRQMEWNREARNKLLPAMARWFSTAERTR